jgi:hypothetical protein
MTVQGQRVKTEVKVETITRGIMIDCQSEASFKNNDSSIARLYLFKNSRIKKELSFITKSNKSKLA